MHTAQWLKCTVIGNL